MVAPERVFGLGPAIFPDKGGWENAFIGTPTRRPLAQADRFQHVSGVKSPCLGVVAEDAAEFLHFRGGQFAALTGEDHRFDSLERGGGRVGRAVHDRLSSWPRARSTHARSVRRKPDKSL